MLTTRILLASLLLAGAAPGIAAPLTDAQRASIDALVTTTLQSTGVPGASIAVVRDGKLDYAKAYGNQRDARRFGDQLWPWCPFQARFQPPSVEHNGGWEGFRSTNRVYPDDQAAVTVFINADFSDAVDAIGDGIDGISFERPDDTATARALVTMLQTGTIDRARFTDNGNFYFNPTVLADYATSLAPLGAAKSITRIGTPAPRGGLTFETFMVRFANQKLLAVLRTQPDTRRIEQFTLTPSSD